MRYAKAFVGAAVAGLGTLATALADDHVTAAEWVGVATATLVALGVVWAVPNRPAPAAPLTVLTAPTAPTTYTNGGTGSNVKLVDREDVKQSSPKSGGYSGGDVPPTG
jgi:hypothetical protein